MNLTLPLASAQLVGFLLVMVRAIAWLSVMPPFGTKMVPVRVRLGLAVALSLALSSKLQSQAVPAEIGPLVSAVVLQAAAGLALGFIGLIAFSVFEMAGHFIDVSGGFAAGQILNPLSGNQSSVFGRFYQLLATVLLFAIDGHLLIVRGFMESFQAVPVSSLSLDVLAKILSGNLGHMLVAALEIAAPLLAALFLTDVALGLLAKAAPEMNVFIVGLPLKIMLTLSLAVVAIPLLPQAVSSTLTPMITDGLRVVRGG